MTTQPPTDPATVLATVVDLRARQQRLAVEADDLANLIREQVAVLRLAHGVQAKVLARRFGVGETRIANMVADWVAANPEHPLAVSRRNRRRPASSAA